MNDLSMADMMDKTINSILTAFVAIVLVASAFIPTVVPMIKDLVTEGSDTYVEDAEVYAALLGVTITLTIVGIFIGIIRTYSGRDDNDSGSFGDMGERPR